MKRKIVLLMLAVMAIGASGKDVYVSKAGKDSNPGTMAQPMLTIKKAVAQKPDRVLLRRGDTFYEAVSVDGIDLGAYGTGDDPVVCGLKILGSKAWTRGQVKNGRWSKSSKDNVWRANLAQPNEQYSGFKTGGSSRSNNVGQIVNTATDDMNQCRRVRYITDLEGDYDFWQGLEEHPDSLSMVAAFDYLYMYLSSDPNKLPLAVAVYSNGITAKNCTVSDLKITHWGRHGVNAGSNAKIRSCTIDAIGGSLQIGYSSWTCLGNGVEYWISPLIENGDVSDCHVSRCFDAGLTIQGGSSTGHGQARNCTFHDNVLENCCQSFEFFLSGTSDEDIFYDCVVRDNKSYNPGQNTGFRYYKSRYKFCHILENSTKRRTGIQYVDNLFVNGNYYCAGRMTDGMYNSPVWKGNTCYILRGQDLMGQYTGSRDVITVPTSAGSYPSIEAATDAAIAQYRALTGDTTTHFIICDSLADMPTAP